MNGTADRRPRCRHHLGVALAVVKAKHEAEVQARILFEQATAAARREGVDLINPLKALHELSDEIWRWKEVCRAMVGELQEIRYRGKAGEQVRAEIELYERGMERSAKVLAEIVRLGIADRLARVNDRTAELVAGVIRGVGDDILLELRRAGIPAEYVDVFRAALTSSAPRRLRALGADQS